MLVTSVRCVNSRKMDVEFYLRTLILCFCFLQRASAQGSASFFIEKFYLCEGVPNQKINMTVVPKSFVSGMQLLDIGVFTPIPLGNQLRFSLSVDLLTKMGTQHLVTAEDDFCRIIQMYLGELAYEVETAMGIPRGICPIPRGHYHAVNYTMDFARLKLQTFPFGKILTTAKFIEKSTKNLLHCNKALVSNNG